ncbi:MAG: aspartate--tRNA ligase, partial [Planctomycetota bacterium]
GARPEGGILPPVNMTHEYISVKCEKCGNTFNTTVSSSELLLKYRYLDLRRDEMKNNLVMRHKITQSIRNYFNRAGFIEVETPYLTKSTPEGARDYLVPSRIFPGKFFALPQSPQLFKQLLMVAGLDKYFQIVRCFRDEDLRAERQPEFTQVDVEMSFVDENDVMNLIEKMCAAIFSEVFNKKLTAPFARITYDEAMQRYGTDKPDLRFGLPLFEVTELMNRSDFRVFKEVIKSGGIVKGLKISQTKEGFSRKEIDQLTELAKESGAKGLVTLKVSGDALSGAVAKFFKPDLQSELMKKIEAGNDDLILLVGDRPEVGNQVLVTLRNYLGEKLGLIDRSEFNFSWVIDFPLFEFDDENKRLSSKHHPFTAPQGAEIANLMKDPLKVKARAYDLVLNGVEVGGGSIRIHSSDLQKQIFKLLDISETEATEKFGFLLEAFKYGAPPHGGIALGLDRFVMLLLGRTSIREVIAFPKTTSSQCLLTGAPDTVSVKQLDELGVRLKSNKSV